MGDAEELLTAAQKNDLAKAKAILDRDPSLLRMRTPNGTLVLTATFYGASDVLKLLLARTPEDALNLYEAATVGNARRLKTILGQSRVRVNEATPEEGFDPLGLAAFFGHSEAVKVLLEHGADVNQKPPSRFANTAVDSAVAAAHTDDVRVDIVRVDEQAVNDPGDRGPLAGGRACLPVVLRTLIVRRRRRDEDPTVPESDLRMDGPPVPVLDSLAFAFLETERTVQPIDGRDGIFVRDHRHDRGHVLRLLLRHFVSSRRESDPG